MRQIIQKTLAIILFVFTALSAMATTYIKEVAVAGDGSSEVARSHLQAEGYTIIDVDLNKKAGGWYVYMGYKTTTDYNEAITDLIINWSNVDKVTIENKSYVQARRLSGFDGDLNHKAGGKYLYLMYSTDGRTELVPAITGLNVRDGSSNNNCAHGYDNQTYKEWAQDLNRGAGGSDLFLEMFKMAKTGDKNIFFDEYKVKSLGGRLYEFTIPLGKKSNNVSYYNHLPKVQSSDNLGFTVNYNSITDNDFTKSWGYTLTTTNGKLYDPATFNEISSGTKLYAQSGNHSDYKYITVLWEAPENFNANYVDYKMSGELRYGTNASQTYGTISTTKSAVDPTAPTGKDNITVVDPYLNANSSSPGWQIVNITSINNVYSYALWDAYLNDFTSMSNEVGGQNNLQLDLPQTDEQHSMVALLYVKTTSTDNSGKQDTTYTTYSAPFTLKPFHEIHSSDLTLVNDTATHGTYNGYDWVQLWKDGPAWATKNVGANTVKDYGIVYYNYSDNAKTVMGGSWRTPTESEAEGLNTSNYCTITPTDDGYLVKGLGAYSNNSILFPNISHHYWTRNNQTQEYSYWFTQAKPYYHDTMKMPLDNAYLVRGVLDLSNLYSLKKELNWYIKCPDQEDIISSDQFRIQRAYSSDYSDAVDLSIISFSDTTHTATVDGVKYGYYSYTDNSEESNTTSKRFGRTTSIFDNWSNISDVSKTTLKKYKYPARYVYYRVSRALVDAKWGSDSLFEAKWKVLLSNVLPGITALTVDTTDNWRKDHKVTVTVKMKNPYPWELVYASDSANVHAEAIRQGFNKRMYSWDSNANIIINRYSPADQHYQGKDEVAKTITIPGSSVVWNEAEGCYIATITDQQVAPYTYYYYKARVDTTNTDYPQCYCDSASFVCSDKDAKIAYSETMAEITSFSATQGTVKGMVGVSWETDEGMIDSFTLERRPYHATSAAKAATVPSVSPEVTAATVPAVSPAVTEVGTVTDWETLVKDEKTSLYKDVDALTEVVYEYRLTANATFRGKPYSSTKTTYGYNPYYGSIKGKIQQKNGAAMPGGVKVRLENDTTYTIYQVKVVNDTVVMAGYTQTQYRDSVIVSDDGTFEFPNVPFKLHGTRYKVTPILGAVSFQNPGGTDGTYSVYMSEKNYDVADVDFTCTKSAQVSGRVLYAGSTVPVRDVNFYVNGVLLRDANGNEIKSDQSGDYMFSVPIMPITIQARKKGHRMQNNGFITPDGADKDGSFTPDESKGVYAVLSDSTTTRLVGRLIGGSRQSSLPHGIGISENNLGDDLTMVMQLEGDNTAQIVYDASNPDNTTRDTVFVQANKKNGVVDTVDATSVSFQKKRIVIKPNVATGEFCVDLYPTKYKIIELTATGYSTLFASGEGFQVLDLTNDTTSVEHKETIATYKADGSVSKVDNYVTHYSDTYQCVYHVPATVTYQQLSKFDVPQEFVGEQYITELNLTGSSTSATVAWEDEDDNPQYAFKYPVFKQGSTYNMKVTAHEDYYYNGTKSTKVDKVNLDGGKLNIYNGLESSTSKINTILDKDGSAVVTLKVDNPCFSLTNEDALRSVHMQVEVNGYYYNSDTLKAFVLGEKDKGVNVLTLDNSINVVDIIRDPYGAHSYAYREKGTKYYWHRDKGYTYNSSFDMSITLGGGSTHYVGVGLATKSEFSVTATVNTSIPMESINDATNCEYTMTLNERIQTSSEDTEVGAMGDVYVGFVDAYNVQETSCFCIIDSVTYSCVAGAIASGSVKLVTQGKDKNGKTFYIVIGDKLLLGNDSVTRTFAYSQKHILGTIIPQLEERLSNLIRTGSQQDIQALANDSRTVQYYRDANGDIQMLRPANDNKIYTNEAQEIVNTISQWNKIIAQNEQKKLDVMANTTTKPFKQYSVATTTVNYTEAESTYYRSVHVSSTFSDDTYNGSVSAGVGINGNGTNNRKSAVDEKNSKSNDKAQESSVNVPGFKWAFSLNPYKFTKTYNNSCTYYEVTSAGSGYVLTTNNNGYMDMDVYRVADSTKIITDDHWSWVTNNKNQQSLDNVTPHDFIFVLRGGAMRTPWFDADSTMVLVDSNNKPYPLGAKSLKIDNPKIYIDNPVVSNVPKSDKAVFSVRLTNETEISDKTKYLTPTTLVLAMDDATNDKGLKIYMDGAPIGTTRNFPLEPGKSITKTIEVERGNGYDFEDIGLIFRDQSKTLKDRASFSVHFVPESSPVTLSLPKDKWIMNTLSATENDDYYIPVEITGFNINYEGFDHIELQYKKQTEGESQWVNLCSYYANDTLYAKASGVKEKITTGTISAKFFGEKDPVEMKYDLRAVSFCRFGTGFVSTSSNISSGIKDTKVPEVFGKPKPANGILTADETISLPFNEEIAYNYLDKTANFSVLGYTNNMSPDHSSHIHFDGDEDQEVYTKVARVLNQRDFTIEMLAQLEENEDTVVLFDMLDNYTKTNNALAFGYIEKQRRFFVWTAEESFLSQTLDETSVKTLHQNMTHIGIEYCAQDSIMKFFFGDNDISLVGDRTRSACTANSRIRLGFNLKGDICDVRIWGRAFNDTYEIANKYKKAPVNGEKDLIAYWPMTEAAGNIAADKANGADLYLKNVSWITPKGYSAKLRGKPMVFTQKGAAKFTTDSAEDYTLTMWFKVNELQKDTVSLFTAGTAGPQAVGDGKMSICFERKKLRLRSNGHVFDFGTDNDYASGKLWHHLALSVNHSQDIASLYIDNKLVNSVSAEEIGGIANDYIAFGGDGFYGNIDNITFWKVAVPASYLSTFYNAKLTGMEKELNVNMTFQGSALDEYQAAHNVYQPYNFKYSTVGVRDETVMIDTTGVTGDGVVYAPIRDGDELVNLPFTWTSTDNALQINIQKSDAYINHQQINLVVRGVEDLQGNAMKSPKMWSVYVDRNVLKWTQSQDSVSVKYGEGTAYTANFKNTSGSSLPYTIDTDVYWLKLSKTRGTISPLASDIVKMSVSEGLSPGNYTANVYITDADSLCSQFTLNVTVHAEEPNWALPEDSTDFTATMNVIAIVKQQDNLGNWSIDNSSQDIVAAFIDKVCVGKARITVNNDNNSSYAFLTLHGRPGQQPDGFNGKPIEFRLWDSSKGDISALAYGETDKAGTWQPVIMRFQRDTIIGATSPAELRVTASKMQQITLKKGWNWVSLNVTPADPDAGLNGLFFDGAAFSEGDLIKRSTGSFSVFHENLNGWDNNSSKITIDRSNVYQIYMHKAGTVMVNGTAIPNESRFVNLVFGTKTVKSNWADLAYLLDVTQPINYALSDFVIKDKAPVGTIIKGHDSFCVAQATGTWLGSLLYLRPGEGYYVKMNGLRDTVKIIYTNNVVFNEDEEEAKAATLSFADYNSLSGGGSDEACDNMPVIATLADGIETQEGDTVVAIVGGAIVGYAPVASSDGLTRSAAAGDASSLLFISVNASTGNSVGFGLYRDGKVIATTSSAVTYSADAVVGNLDTPYVIDFTNTLSEGDLYDLMGRKVNSKATPHGVYINGNTKIVK